MTTTATHRCLSWPGEPRPFETVWPPNEDCPFAVGYCGDCDTEKYLPADTVIDPAHLPAAAR